VGQSTDQAIGHGFNAATNMVTFLQAIEQGNDFSALLAGVHLVDNLGRAINGRAILPDSLSTGLGTVATTLNFVDAFEQDAAGGMIVSGVSLGNLVSESGLGASNAISSGLTSVGIEVLPANVVPYLGMFNSLAHGDPVGAAASYLMMNPATFYIGAVLAFVDVFCGGLFSDDPDIPTSYGNTTVGWSENGGVAVTTSQDEMGGGSVATGWMNNLVTGLQDHLDQFTDASGRHLYGIDPTRLPTIAYAFDPDTQDGYLRLTWTDPDGTVHWRQYDTSGMRNDGQSEAGTNDLVRDFFLHAADAVIPAWEADTRFQQQGSHATATPATPELFLGEPSADGNRITRSVFTLGGDGSVAPRYLDLDGDGYAEATDWTQSPLLAIDVNGDGQASPFELVDGRAGADSRLSLGHLDANGDGLLDSRDPAFAALTLWVDTNGNGRADAGESASLTGSGIVSINFSGDSATVTRADGSSAALSRQDLTGDTQGIAQTLSTDGLYEAHEGGETLLYAVNQHSFDGDAAHTHGGEENPASFGEETFAAGDRRIQSTGSATVASTTVQVHVQGDSALRDAGDGIALTGQGAGVFLGSEADLIVVSDAPGSASPGQSGHAPVRIAAGDPRVISDPRIPAPPRTSHPIVLPFAFVPAVATSPARATRQVTQDMITSAGSGLFGSGASPLAAMAKPTKIAIDISIRHGIRSSVPLSNFQRLVADVPLSSQGILR
jgi:hypothetical protein